MNRVERERWHQLLREGRAAAAALPPESPTRAVSTACWFDGLEASDPPAESGFPPLLLHLSRLRPDQLTAFDADLTAVRAAMTAGGSRQEFLKFGQQFGEQSARQWGAGMIEMGVQAHLIRELDAGGVTVSPQLPNGRHADAVVKLGERQIWIEISALSDDDAVIADFSTVRSVQAVTGDPYLDARRVYRKVFDKAAGTGNGTRSQLHPEQPSIVVVGDAAWRSAGFRGLGFGWALDQLTDPSLRTDRSRASLMAWLDHDFPGRADTALDSLDQLSALAVVGSDLGLIDFRVNTTADAAHKLRLQELDDLAGLLDARPSWR